MKLKYFIPFFFILCTLFFLVFSKKRNLIKGTIQRNFSKVLEPDKILQITKSFGLRNFQQSFVLFNENGTYLLNDKLDSVNKIDIDVTYFVNKIQDTLIHLKENSTLLYKKYYFKTDSFKIERNQGYIAYKNNEVYYEKIGNPISKDFEIETILFKKNLGTNLIDTFFNVTDFLKNNFEKINSDEYNNICTGSFFNLINGTIAFVPRGINRIFIFNNGKVSILSPLNESQVIRWESIKVKVPTYGDVFTFKPKTGNKESFFLGIYTWHEKYIIINNEKYAEKDKLFYYVDIYDVKNNNYLKTYKILCKNDNSYLFSFAVNEENLFTLDSKGFITKYILQ